MMSVVIYGLSGILAILVAYLVAEATWRMGIEEGWKRAAQASVDDRPPEVPQGELEELLAPYWPKAPEWAQWAAMDKDERWGWYAEEPYKLGDEWCISSYRKDYKAFYGPEWHGDWREAKVKRPDAVACKLCRKCGVSVVPGLGSLCANCFEQPDQPQRPLPSCGTPCNDEDREAAGICDDCDLPDQPQQRREVSEEIERLKEECADRHDLLEEIGEVIDRWRSETVED